MLPDIPAFSDKDPIHAKVIESLKVITGRDFYLAQVNTSSGKVWVYRTEAKRHTSEHSDLLDNNDAKPIDSPNLWFPATPIPPNLAALQYATRLLRKMRDSHPLMSRKGEYIGSGQARVDSIANDQGGYIGVLDLYAESKPDRKCINVDGIIALAGRLKAEGNHQTPDYGLLDKVIDTAEASKLEALVTIWADRIRDIAANAPAVDVPSVQAARLIEGIAPRADVEPRPPIKPRGDRKDEGRNLAKGGLDI